MKLKGSGKKGGSFILVVTIVNNVVDKVTFTFSILAQLTLFNIYRGELCYLQYFDIAVECTERCIIPYQDYCVQCPCPCPYHPSWLVLLC